MSADASAVSVAPEIVAAAANCTVASVVWRMQGHHHVTVIAKATFAMVDDADMQLTVPQQILRAEVHHRNNPARSIRWSGDMSPYIPLADVVYTGIAYPPPGPRVPEMPVRLAVFSGESPAIDKRLILRDARGVQQTNMAYEVAFGGIGVAENPYGTREPKIIFPGEPERVAGFGPIGRAWAARKQLLGSTSRQVIDAPVPEFPDTFDWSYFQSAPPDQRMPYLRGDEWVVLEGLHRSLLVMRSRLPDVRALARVYGLSSVGLAEGLPLELRADTLRIDGDLEQCTLVWRRSFPVASEAVLRDVRVVAGVELPGAPIAWIAPQGAVRASPISKAPAPQRTGETIDIGDDDIEVASARASGPLGSDTLDVPGDRGDRSLPLPFRPSWGAPEVVRREFSPAPPSLGTGTVTLSDEDEPAEAPLPLPFRTTAEPLSRAVAMGETPKPPAQPVAMGETPKPPAQPVTMGETPKPPAQPVTVATEPVAPAPAPSGPPKSPWGTAYDVTRTRIDAASPASSTSSTSSTSLAKAAPTRKPKLDIASLLYGTGRPALKRS